MNITTSRLLLVAALAALIGCGSRDDAVSTGSGSTADVTPARTASPTAVTDAVAVSDAPSAKVDVDTLEPSVRAAAALSRRVLPTPSPQIENLRRDAPAPAFDRAAYLADPAAYLDVAAPERATEPAQPAADVPMLTAVGGMYAAVPPGGSVVLRARTEPGMPVTFSSSGLGSFDSGVPTITVAADESGVASARFTVTPGTTGACPILAASPVRGGNLRYLVNVLDQ